MGWLLYIIKKLIVLVYTGDTQGCKIIFRLNRYDVMSARQIAKGLTQSEVKIGLKLILSRLQALYELQLDLT